MKMHPEDLHTLDAMAPEDRPSLVELDELPTFRVVKFERRMPCYYILEVCGQHIQVAESDTMAHGEPGHFMRLEEALPRIALRKRFPGIRFTIAGEYLKRVTKHIDGLILIKMVKAEDREALIEEGIAILEGRQERTSEIYKIFCGP